MITHETIELCNNALERLERWRFNIRQTLCTKQVQQLEKKLKEGTDQTETSAPPVRGKWSTLNNPHRERYQSKLQDIQKERRAATEVSQALLERPKMPETCKRPTNEPVKTSSDAHSRRGGFLSGPCRIVSTPHVLELLRTSACAC